MTNFQFLHPEFKSLLEPAKGAEQRFHPDSRASCLRAHFALEQAVHWLYEHDHDHDHDHDHELRMPHDGGCSVETAQGSQVDSH